MHSPVATAQTAPALDPRFAARERQPGLDLLRAVAILIVVCYHAGNFGFTLPHDWQRFGWVGVDLFFVLSGYLIGGQLLAPLARGEALDLPRFYWRRALRILPAYVAVLAAYALLPGWREWPTLPPLWRFLAFVQNLDLHGGTAFSHAWSLCVEGQFYFVLPILLLLVVRWRLGGVWAVGGVMLAGVALRAAVAYWNVPTDGTGALPYRIFQHFIYYPTATRLDPLALGVGLAGVERFRPQWWQRWMGAARWLWLPGLAAVGFGIWLGEGETGVTVAACVWQFPLVALGMAALLICAVSERLPLRRVAVPGAAFLASVAYSVYLSHKLVIHAVGQICIARHWATNSAAALTLNLAAVLAVGAGSFFAVERPFLLLRRRKTKENFKETYSEESVKGKAGRQSV